MSEIEYHHYHHHHFSCPLSPPITEVKVVLNLEASLSHHSLQLTTHPPVFRRHDLPFGFGPKQFWGGLSLDLLEFTDAVLLSVPFSRF